MIGIIISNCIRTTREGERKSHKNKEQTESGAHKKRSCRRRTTMGAMAPPPHWIPEDDVLLKNAVEAGASLESLAKGAVQFSRRFTVQELQDRWFSLLYDPVVSVEASVHMIDVERSGITNQLRPNKLEGLKDIACSSGKRKTESVRTCYYAMRKRICNEPFDIMDINLVSGPGLSNFRDGNEFSSSDCRTANLASNNLGTRGPDYDIKPYSFPEFGPHAVESTGNDGTPSFSAVQNHGQEDIGRKIVSDIISYPYEENISLTGDCSEIPGFVQPKDLSLRNLFEAEDLVNQGSSTCSEFGGQSFRSFGCPPPLPQMPTWHSSQEISAEGLPIQIGDGDLQIRDEFMIPHAANESDALGYGGGPSNPKLETPHSCDSMLDMNSSTKNFLDVLFDLSIDQEECNYADNDGKKAIEKSYIEGLSSLLMDSPQCVSYSSGSGEVAVAADGHLVDRSDTHNGGSNNRDLHGQHEVADAQVTASGSTMKIGPEYRNGVICCTFNTEDPEIPSNDDVFLPFRFPSPTNISGAHWGLHDPSYLGTSSVKNFSSTCNANGGPLLMKNSQKDSSVPSGKKGSFHQLDVGLRYGSDHGVKFELPESSVQNAAPGEARSSECTNPVSSANANANNFISGVVNKGPMEMGHGKNIGYTSLSPCPDKHESSLNVVQNLHKNSIGSRSGANGIAEIPNNGSLKAELSFQQTDVPKAIDQSLLSDKEDLWSENEFEVPYFSDVEAMILDMDLSPDEFDLYTNPEVQRYQHEETKRTIIRLEQAADAFTQRIIAGQGAFAVLYGRCSKHFIKKPEVLLGRATDDIKVDIDLGREKNGSKISRRQATMKMDMHGTFHLKNLGKAPIYMNGKEVAPGQSLCLISGCLIEVRGLTFVFETNRKMIKQYVDSTAGGFLADHKPSTRS
ncbi:hypothetical protein C2S52_014130 [Perilla frutescens var. hirtella]|nr:hypothetical protein C2S52_014130 [Perilla frutescens var. hirtella]